MTLGPIFEPRSIAVVGASTNPTKRGHQILRALADSGYAGRVYAVSPRGGRLLGHEVHTSVDELPEAADLAVICTPAATVPDLVRACGERGVAGAVVLGVGFGESGPAGADLEARLREAAHNGGVRVVGPNTSGLLNLPMGVNLIGARGVRPGSIALLVQSGNIALDLMTRVTEDSRMGISICCGVGNEADVGFGEVLAFLGDHDDTRVIIAHIEGCNDPRALLRAAASVTRRKPVVVIKSGRTAAGAHAALSHTGAIAGPYDRLRAGFAQAGVVEITRTDELLHVAATLGSQPCGPPGTGVSILSDGGGQSTLVVDTLHEMGVPLATLAPETSAELRARLGPAAAVCTPVDVAGAADADPGVFARALEVIAADPSVGVVLVVGLFGGYGIRFSDTLAGVEAEAARSMAASMRALGKGLVVHSQYASHASGALDAFREAHVPVIGSLEVACRAAAELQRRGSRASGPRRWQLEGAVPGSAAGDSFPHAAVERATERPHPVIAAVRREGRVACSETESRELLEAAGLEFEPVEVVRSADQAAAAVGKVGQAVAIKLLSRHITHKSDVGGVVLDVATAQGAREAFASIAKHARAHARAQGLPAEAPAATVSSMFDAPVTELLVGAYRDPRLGPVLTVGAGGIWVEVLRDVAHRVLPVDEGEIEAALKELKVNALLAGARGGQAARLGPIVAAAAAVAECAMRWPEVAEAEVNPLFVYRDRVVPVDARVVLTSGS